MIAACSSAGKCAVSCVGRKKNENVICLNQAERESPEMESFYLVFVK
jgi:hypothetical protein